MKKLIKNEICGSVNSARMHCSRKTGQMLRLLFMYSTWTVAACEGENVWKKKKKKKEKTQKRNTGNATLYPNITNISFSIFNFFSLIFFTVIQKITLTFF